MEAKNQGLRTAFLCHSHHDAVLAKGLVVLLAEAGWTVYIDWEDHEMPSSPNRETAERIQRKIKEHSFFLFLATEKSMSSRWCPWELGYADGVKDFGRIFVVPTAEGSTTHGNEYLQLYRRIDLNSLNQAEVWAPGAVYASTPIRSV